VSDPGGPHAASLTEALRGGYEAFNRRDSRHLRELMVDDFQWNESEQVPGRKVCRSAEEFLAYMEGFDQLWDEFAFEPLEFRVASEDTVVAAVRGMGRGKASGVPFDLTIHHVWRFRGGRVARMDAFLDAREAADEAGLRPGD